MAHLQDTTPPGTNHVPIFCFDDACKPAHVPMMHAARRRAYLCLCLDSLRSVQPAYHIHATRQVYVAVSNIRPRHSHVVHRRYMRRYRHCAQSPENAAAAGGHLVGRKGGNTGLSGCAWHVATGKHTEVERNQYMDLHLYRADLKRSHIPTRRPLQCKLGMQC